MVHDHQKDEPSQVRLRPRQVALRLTPRITGLPRDLGVIRVFINYVHVF